MAITPFGEWAPDQPSIAEYSELVSNGIPQDTGYYGPARELVEQDAAMTSISATIASG